MYVLHLEKSLKPYLIDAYQERKSIMASGSYFTIYRKLNKSVPNETLDKIKNEYFESNKANLFDSSKPENELKEDIPLFLDPTFKSTSIDDGNSNYIYYNSDDGKEYLQLLTFDFISTFSCLKEHWDLNPYSYKRATKVVSKVEAAAMLQAIKYVLGGKYSQEFEDILSNEYVDLFGNGYSPYDNRFKAHDNSPVYFDRNDDDGFIITKGDDGIAAEIAESDADAKWNLEHTKIALETYLHASEYCSNDNGLVLTYTAW